MITRTRPPRPLDQWFEMKDHHSAIVVHLQLKILQRQETGEPLEGLQEALAFQQRCLETITRKCDYLFFQWNCLGHQRGGWR